MDDSAFKSILDRLDALSQSLHGRLTFWTWLVVLGVFLEIGFIIWNHVEERGDWFHAKTRGVISPPSKPSVIKLICEFLSVVLVVAGVSGELAIDAKLGQIETRIRDVNEQRVLKLQQEAGDAAESAERAEKAAKILEDRANAIQDEMMWQGSRDIILFKNKDFLHRQLTPFRGQKAVTAICKGQYLFLGDQELSNVGGSIGSILADAHWKSTDAFPLPHAGITSVFDDKCPTLGYGVEISVSSEASASVRKAAEALSASLNIALREPGDVSKITPQLFGIDTQGHFHVLDQDTVKVEVRMHFPLQAKIWPKGSLEERMKEEEKKQAPKNQPAK